MTGPSPVQRLHANLAYLKQRGASHERIQQELEKFKASQDQASANDRKLSGLETAGAAASKFAGGATFGLFDEAAGLWGDKDTHRYLQKQLEEENPALAMGSEIAGALAVPIPFVKPAAKAASLGAKAGRVLLEGAIQGGLAGAGNAEGGLEERLRSAAKGATIGSVASGVIGGAGRALARGSRRAGEALGLTAPSLDDLVAKIPDEDILAGRKRLSEISGRNLGHEATVADVLPQGEGALRQAATANKSVRKNVDAALRQRSNRLSNEADERLTQYSGSEGKSAAKTLHELDATASAQAKPHYQAADEEAQAFEAANPHDSKAAQAMRDMGVSEEKIAETLGAENPVRAQLREASQLPYVRQRIGELRADPLSGFKDAADDSHKMLDQVYKELGDDIRGLREKEYKSGLSNAERKELRDFVQQRTKLRDAIVGRSPSYEKGLSEYAGPKASGKAFERGTKVGQMAPDVIPDELARMDPAEQRFFKRGGAEAFRTELPAPELGELARFHDVVKGISTKAQAQRFKALYGEDAFKNYLADLLQMAKLQKMKAGAGESTTVDKLLEQVQSDPESVAQALGALIRGNPIRAVVHAVPFKALDRLRNSKVAQTNADFLLRRGEPEVTRSLDDLVRMREAAQRPGRSSFSKPAHRYREAASRTVGGHAGKN